jgi:hypothetical protein
LLLGIIIPWYDSTLKNVSENMTKQTIQATVGETNSKLETEPRNKLKFKTKLLCL